MYVHFPVFPLPTNSTLLYARNKSFLPNPWKNLKISTSVYQLSPCLQLGRQWVRSYLRLDKTKWNCEFWERNTGGSLRVEGSKTFQNTITKALNPLERNKFGSEKKWRKKEKSMETVKTRSTKSQILDIIWKKLQVNKSLFGKWKKNKIENTFKKFISYCILHQLSIAWYISFPLRRSHSSSTQMLLLALCSEVTSDSPGGLYLVPRIEPGL